jgi:hypothetical protein
MLSNIKARIMRFCDLSWKDLTNLKAWGQRSATFNSFPLENFNSPLLKVAVASADGEVVCMTPIETCYMVSAFLGSPNATPEQATLAGDEIDRQLSMEAQRAGVSSLLIMLPENHRALRGKEFGEFKTVRVYERKFSQTVGTGGVTLSQANSIATNLIN